MNAPDRFELFILPEGKKKVLLEPDTKIPNAATITFEREDHTLGNMVRAQLLHDDRVIFAAYRVPHPLEHNVVLRVQTDEGYEPKEAVINAANVLLVQLTQLRSNFEQEWELKKLSSVDGEVEF